MSNPIANLKGSLYMRIFGNELRYMNFNSMDDLTPQLNALEMLINLAENNDYSYT